MAKRSRARQKDDDYSEAAVKKTKTRAPRIEWTAKDEAALKFALSIHGTSYSAIQKEYFPGLRAKEVQNKVHNNPELREVANALRQHTRS